MEKMNLVTKNLTDENIQRILELFPNVATEKEDENGKLKTGIDFDKLKQELSEVVVDGEESYDFTWVGKKEAMIEANRPIRKTLRPDKESSVNWDTTENIYIEGDNLDALKLLQESYMGKVKMIYIDPPYNTGKDFVYRDNFTQDKNSYEEEIGAKDEEGNRLFQNTESNGRFHSDWCSMIYSRLKLARNLLSDDGVIFISIDDNEVNNLRKICDEVFGEENFVSNIVWQSTIGSNTGENTITTVTENILVYSKSNNRIINKEKFINDGKMKLQDEYFNRRGYYALDKLDSVRQSSHYTESMNYPITCPDGSRQYPGGESYRQDGWNYLWSKTKVEWGLQNGFIEFKKNGTKWNIYNKRYELVDNCDNPCDRGTIFRNILLSSFCTTASGAKEIEELFGKKLFDYPKSTKLLNKLEYIGSQKDSIILDFFSGSATTAHAVMQLNAEDGGNRKFIMVQLPEITNEKSEAYKAGYKNICEIGEERIRRAGKKIQEENPDKKLDIGFRVFKVDDTNMKDVYYTPNEYSQNLLSSLESNIKDDRTDEDLLYGCLLDWGVELSLPHRIEMIDGKRIHIVNEDDLIACFEENISETVVKEIAKKQPTRVVFRDSSFNSDDNRINVEEIFKLQSPNTRVKVI